MKHLEFRQLVDLLEGSLAEGEKHKVSEHTAGCAECKSQVQKLETFLAYAKREKHESVGHNVTARLLNIYHLPKAKKSSVSVMDRLLSTLVFDDWQTALNERFVSSDSRQLLYRAGDFEIDLRLNMVGENCIIVGQVFPDCGSGGTVEILSPDFSKVAHFDENCEFTFPYIKQGTYDLIFTIENSLIEIRNFSMLV